MRTKILLLNSALVSILFLMTNCNNSNKEQKSSVDNSKDIQKIIETEPMGSTTENNQAVSAKAEGPIKIIELEKKVRKGKYYWFTFYVENYVDNKETENKMVEVSKKLPYESSGGFTEVFFFNNKANAPKLANDGGWGDNESQNSWNAKYGKYCVGYYMVGAGESGAFSKGWN